MKMNTINYYCPCNIYFFFEPVSVFTLEKNISNKKNNGIRFLGKILSDGSINKTLILLNRIHHSIILARQCYPTENKVEVGQDITLVLTFTAL